MGRVIAASQRSAILASVNVIGDLERLFATSLYPLRVPIAIAVVFGLAGLAILARRRGWPAAARRHPRRSGAFLAAVLAVGLPIAWYLGSPLFIRTALIEPPIVVAEEGSLASAAPVAGATPERADQPTANGSPSPAPSPSASPDASPTPGQSLTADAPPTPSTPSTPRPSPTRGPSPSPRLSPTPFPTPSPTPFVAQVVTSGSFQGADDFHFGEGTASIIEVARGQFALRFDAFSVRNGPDLYVYLSPDRTGYAAGVLELGTLKATDGAFSYDLPAGTDPSAFASAVIWCKQFAVQFAVAAFEGS